MSTFRFKRFGPFSYFRTKRTGGISAWWTGKDNASWGWEWGYQDDVGSSTGSRVHLSIRIGKLVVAHYETWPRKGLAMHFMGFWWHR